MTVHWNSRRGFSGGLNTASSPEEQAGTRESETALLAELRLAMRKTPETRDAFVERGRKLLADPNYPSRTVLKRVAKLLARHWDDQASA